MFKKIKWYLLYRNTINKNSELLFNRHNLKIDWVNRLYKTYTLTDDDLTEVKKLGGVYINTLLEKERNVITNTFLSLGISEFVKIMELKQLNEKQIGIAFEFKFLNISKITNYFIWTIVSLLNVYNFYLLNCQINSIYFGLITSFVIYILTRLLKINRTED